MNPVERGRVVVPRAGRDKGRPMVVLRIEGEYAFLADGRLRKAENPKKKKMKHVFPRKECFSTLRESINHDTVVSDAQIRRFLEEMGEEEGEHLG